jgi:pyrroline-5-carboxylate reductase
MGGILLQAFLKNNLLGADQIFATVQHAERAQALSAQFGVEVTTDNLAAARQADVILLGVKPIQVPSLIEEIKDALTPKKTVLSFAASVKTRSIEDGAGCELAVIRAMPNTPAMLDGLSRRNRWRWRRRFSTRSARQLLSMRSTWMR